MKKCIALFAVSIENLENLKYHTSLKKALVFSVICSKSKNEDERFFKDEESIEILKTFDLIENKSRI